jgi:hypothetical protein
MNARFDPVDAFLRGISSMGLRAPIALAAVLAGWMLNLAADPAHHEDGLGDAMAGVGLGSLAMIFAWASQGWPFIVGGSALLAGLIFTYRFIADEGGKLEWFFIFACFGLYFLPMNFTRIEWIDAQGRRVDGSYSIFLAVADDAQPVTRRPWIALTGLGMAVGAIYWLVPPLVAKWVASKSSSQPSASSGPA